MAAPSPNSSAESYFPASNTTSQSNTPASTPGFSGADSPLSSTQAHPLPVLAWDIPKPTKEIDINEALQRQPGRWTFQGQLQANRKREHEAATAKLCITEPKESLEDIKRELLLLQKDIDRVVMKAP